MKKLFSILVLVCVFAGAVGAQSFSGGVQETPLDLGFGLNLDTLQYGGWDPAELEASRYKAEKWKAGTLNMAGGAWSWTHGDILGGALTAGVEAAGVALVVSAFFAQDLDYSIWARLGGGCVAFVGAGIGLLRGMSQYAKQNPVAAGFGDNPVKHTSFVVASDTSENGGMTASLVYSTKL